MSDVDQADTLGIHADQIVQDWTKLGDRRFVVATVREDGEMLMPPEAAAFPDPGEELILRVAGGPDRAAFFWSGRESVRELERTLAIADRPLESFESILDFGCGCGRMLLWLEALGKAHALHGTDVDAAAVAWCQENIPYAQVTVNAADPPLPYADNAFDLIFNHSVFTHIDERRQDRWLAELQRVTRPGGLLVLSVHGEHALEEAPLDITKTRDQLTRAGISFMDRSVPRDFPLPDWYQTTWHAPWYVFEHWGRWFEIRAYVPRGALALQDHVLLERTSDAGPSRRPLSARLSTLNEDAAERRVTAALIAARTHRERPIAGSRPTQRVRGLVRRALLRAIRPYTAHEDEFDEAVVTSIAELSHALTHQAVRLSALEEKLDTRNNTRS